MVGSAYRHRQGCVQRGMRAVRTRRQPSRCDRGALELTRAPLGYFYNAPHWGGGGAISSPPLISEINGPILKIQTAFERPGKNCRGKTNFIDLGVTSDVTGQVKVKMFDISGLVTSASKIAMLSTNKAN